MKIIITIIAFLLFNSLYAQQIKNYKVVWGTNIKAGEQECLSFVGASYDENFLPVFTENLKVSKDGYNVKLINKKFSPLSSEEMKLLDENLLKNSIFTVSNVYSNRNQNFLSVTFVPLRINSQTNSIEKLVSFDIQYSSSKTQSTKNKSVSSVDVSEMNSGDWLKLGVVKSGVYKITFDYLSSLGVSTIDPRVYGYGGAVLPEYNGDEMPDDMNELAIKIEK